MSNVLQLIRSQVVEEGECELWTGRIYNRSPQLYLDGKYRMVRRLVWETLRGPIAEHLRARAVCGNPACVAAAHIRLMSVGQVGRHAAKLGGSWSRPERRAAIALSRRRASRLTPEQVRQIRVSDDPSPIVAAAFGISRGMVWKIRTGQAWADGVCGASVFTWRPAA